IVRREYRVVQRVDQVPRFTLDIGMQGEQQPELRIGSGFRHATLGEIDLNRGQYRVFERSPALERSVPVPSARLRRQVDGHRDMPGNPHVLGQLDAAGRRLQQLAWAPVPSKLKAAQPCRPPATSLRPWAAAYSASNPDKPRATGVAPSL